MSHPMLQESSASLSQPLRDWDDAQDAPLADFPRPPCATTVALLLLFSATLPAEEALVNYAFATWLGTDA